MDAIIFQKIGKGSPYTTVVALKNKVVLHLKKIPSSLILMLLAVTAIGASEIVEGIFFLCKFLKLGGN
jgi:hypothetical protein